MKSDIKITINGNACSFNQGETILQVAEKNGIEIPTLCYLKNAATTGDCGVCIVEIQGNHNLKPACSTPAEENMVVLTESAKVIDSRKKVIQQLLSIGNHNCAISKLNGNDWTQFQLKVQQADASMELCPAWGDCRLQDLAYRYQVTRDADKQTDIPYPTETVNPFIVRDFSRCILCGRCVRACNEVQVNKAIDLDHSQEVPKVIAGEDKSLKDSNCVFCGECVQACPVGALVEKDARYDVRPWQIDKKVRTTCSYCGVGCQLHLHVREKKVVKVSGVENSLPNYGSLCVKGRFGYHFIHSQERLTRPLIKRNGTFYEADWDEALKMVAEKLSAIKIQFGSDSLGLLASARITNEDNYIAQKFARAQ